LTVSNSRPRDTIGRLEEDHILEADRKQLENTFGDKWNTLGDNWKTNSGRQMETVEDNWKTILRPHLGEKWKTTRQQPKKPWRQLGDNIWETSRRQLHLGDKWKTRQQV